MQTLTYFKFKNLNLKLFPNNPSTQKFKTSGLNETLSQRATIKKNKNKQENFNQVSGSGNLYFKYEGESFIAEECGDFK